MIKMLYDKVLVKPFNKDFFVDEEGNRKTEGGIYIPDSVTDEKLDKAEEGVVLATGKGTYDHGIFIENHVKPGDKVLFGKYAGSRTQIDEEDVLILKDKDIIAIFEEEEKDGK